MKRIVEASNNVSLSYIEGILKDMKELQSKIDILPQETVDYFDLGPFHKELTDSTQELSYILREEIPHYEEE
jgi:hypothetical protein